MYVYPVDHPDNWLVPNVCVALAIMKHLDAKVENLNDH
jgi:hypothetical protein